VFSSSHRSSDSCRARVHERLRRHRDPI
jgi:hypothetical protein